MKTISSIKCYRSNFEVFTQEGYVSIQRDEFMDEDGRPVREKDARERLADVYGFTDEDQNEVIGHMHTYEWIISNNRVYVYKINFIEAPRADEKGERWMLYCPTDTQYYKHECMEQGELVLPEGYDFDDDSQTIFYQGEAAELVTEDDGTLSLVTSQGITPVKVF